jgi:hypothetical protein
MPERGKDTISVRTDRQTPLIETLTISGYVKTERQEEARFRIRRNCGAVTASIFCRDHK